MNSHETQQDEHVFDPQPVATLAADEPRSPLWLPLVGLALFAAAGGWCLVTGDEVGAAPAASTASSSAEPPRPPGFADRVKLKPGALDRAKRGAKVPARRPAPARGAKAAPRPRIRKIERRPDGTGVVK
ncbi:MAG: hypothetical protein VB934_09800 [Polyangiaceae bacterium]